MADEELSHETVGDEAGPLEVEAGDDDLMKWLKVSTRFALLEKRVANAEQIVNRITCRFAQEGRPLPEGKTDAA